MESTTYQVVFLGHLRTGCEPGDTSKKLTARFGLPADQADQLVSAGKQVIVKKDVDRKTGETIRRNLEQAGLVVELVPTPAAPSAEMASQAPAGPAGPPPVPPDTPAKSSDTPLKPAGPPLVSPSAENIGAAGASSANPYAAPRADLDAEEADKTRFGTPRKVRAGQGWQWLMDAYSMLKERPWAWMGAIALMYFLGLLTNLVPLIGPFIGYFLFPVFFGGLMLGAQAHNDGDIFQLNYLFAGFAINRNQLMLFALLMVLGILVCVAPLFLFFGVSIFTGAVSPESFSSGNILMLVVGFLVSLGVSIPLYMAAWFATPLIAINGYDAWPAMKLSFAACWKNFWPFTVYGLVLMLLFMGITIISGIAMAILVPLFFSVQGALPAMFIFPLVMMVVMVPVISVVSLSIYTGYRDLFYS